MKFMMIVKASKESEAGVMPSEALLSAMGKYNEELMEAGVLLDLAGLQPSSKGTRIKFSGGKRTIIDGPFTEAKELHRRLLDHPGQVPRRGPRVGQARSRSHEGQDGEGEIELRQFFELDDFAPAKLSIGTANSARNSKQKNNSRSCRFRRLHSTFQ